MLRKGDFKANADREGPDQTAHPRSLIWAFVVRFAVIEFYIEYIHTYIHTYIHIYIYIYIY